MCAVLRRWRVQLMERAIARLDFGGSRADKIMQVHDYNGTNMFAIDGRIKEASKHIIKLFQVNKGLVLSRSSSVLTCNRPEAMDWLQLVID